MFVLQVNQQTLFLRCVTTIYNQLTDRTLYIKRFLLKIAALVISEEVIFGIANWLFHFTRR